MAPGRQSATWNGEESDAMDRSVTLLGPATEGLPRAWTDSAEGLELSEHNSAGVLTYTLKIPLQPHAPRGFALGLKPGDSLTVSLDAAGQEAGPPLDEPEDGPTGPGDPTASLGLLGGVGRRRGEGRHPRRLPAHPGQPFWYDLRVTLSRPPLARP
jgi:hypothetical protein